MSDKPIQSELLSQYFGCYFHQDALYGPGDIIYNGSPDIVHTFVSEAPAEWTTGVIRDLKRLLSWSKTQKLTSEQLRTILYNDYGCERSFSEDTEQWLIQMLDQLVRETKQKHFSDKVTGHAGPRADATVEPNQSPSIPEDSSRARRSGTFPPKTDSDYRFLIGSLLIILVGLGVWAIANRSSATLPSQTSSQLVEPTKTVTRPPPPTHAVSEVRHALKYSSRQPGAYVFDGIAYSIGTILYDDNHTFVQIIAKGLSDGAMSAYHPNISFDFWMKPWVEHNFIIDSSGNRYPLIPALVEYQGHIDHDQIPLAKGEITRFILAYKKVRINIPSVTVHFTACRNCPERTETVDILHESRGSITQTAGSTEILVAPDNPRCADRARLRSKPSYSGVTEETFILFNNSSDEVRKVWWRDQDGDERNDKGERLPYKTLGPGESYTQQTYPGHIWVITDTANKCVQVAVGIEVIRQIQIRR